MAKLVKLIGLFVLVIWQLPQVLVGALVRLISSAEFNEAVSEEYHACVFNWKLSSGISLSPYYIIVNKDASSNTIKHEKGHAKQSLYLGPLYLIVIGLPSIIWAGIVHRLTNKSYHWFYTESWADKLGGVAR